MSVAIVLANLALFSAIRSALEVITTIFPFDDDPYYYYINTLNTVITGSLRPEFIKWHFFVEILPYYPVMHTLTAGFLFLTGTQHYIESIYQSTIFIAMLTSLLPIFAYLLGKYVTRDDRISLYASIFVALNSGLVFFQYHQQYLAVIFYFIILAIAAKNDKKLLAVGLLFLPIFSFTHRASDLIFAVAFFGYMTVFLIKTLMTRGKGYGRGMSLTVILFGAIFSVICITCTYSGFLTSLIKEYSLNLPADPLFNSIISFNAIKSDPMQVLNDGRFAVLDYFSNAKFILLALSAFGLIAALRSPYKKNLENMALLYVMLLATTIVAGVVYFESMLRFFLFFIPVMGLFFALLIAHVSKKKLPVRSALMLLIVLVLFCDTVYSIKPQLLVNDHNIIPDMQQYYTAGIWIHGADDGYYYDTVPGLTHIPGYFGEVPYNKIWCNKDFNISKTGKNQMIVMCKKYYGPYLKRDFAGYISVNVSKYDKNNKVYDNGQILLYN